MTPSDQAKPRKPKGGIPELIKPNQNKLDLATPEVGTNEKARPEDGKLELSNAVSVNKFGDDDR